MVDWLLDGLGLEPVLPEWQRAGGQPSAAAPQVVLWVWRDGRAPSQAGIMAALKAGLSALSPPARLVNADFARLGVEDQIQVVRGADVMVSYHGAGLTLSLFMRPEAALIEIEETFRCRCARITASHARSRRVPEVRPCRHAPLQPRSFSQSHVPSGATPTVRCGGTGPTTCCARGPT